MEPFAGYVAVRFEEQHRDCQRVLGLLLDVTRGHPQRAMMLAAHLFAHTPAGGAADEATFKDALAGALLDADGELHGRWDAHTVSQRRAIAALASGEAPFSQTAARQHATSKGATGKALAALAQAGDIAQDPTAATGSMIIDPLMHVWLRRRGRD